MNTLDHISFEKNGSTWLGHIIGSEQEIELAHNSLFNFGATGTRRLDFITPTHATFWTTEDSMYAYLVSRNMNMILNETPERFKKQKGGAMVESLRLAKEQLANLKFHEDARSFSAPVYEYEFQQNKEHQKVENLSEYLVSLIRGDKKAD